MREDFWLVDDDVAVVMTYDAEGHFLQPRLAGDVRPYLEMRAAALRHAEPLNEYVSRRDLRLRA